MFQCPVLESLHSPLDTTALYLCNTLHGRLSFIFIYQFIMASCTTSSSCKCKYLLSPAAIYNSSCCISTCLTSTTSPGTRTEIYSLAKPSPTSIFHVIKLPLASIARSIEHGTLRSQLNAAVVSPIFRIGWTLVLLPVALSLHDEYVCTERSPIHSKPKGNRSNVCCHND